MSDFSARLDAELAYEMAVYGRPLNDYLDDSDDDWDEEGENDKSTDNR